MWPARPAHRRRGEREIPPTRRASRCATRGGSCRRVRRLPECRKVPWLRGWSCGRVHAEVLEVRLQAERSRLFERLARPYDRGIDQPPARREAVGLRLGIARHREVVEERRGDLEVDAVGAQFAARGSAGLSPRRHREVGLAHGEPFARAERKPARAGRNSLPSAGDRRPVPTRFPGPAAARRQPVARERRQARRPPSPRERGLARNRPTRGSGPRRCEATRESAGGRAAVRGRRVRFRRRASPRPATPRPCARTAGRRAGRACPRWRPAAWR